MRNDIVSMALEGLGMVMYPGLKQGSVSSPGHIRSVYDGAFADGHKVYLVHGDYGVVHEEVEDFVDLHATAKRLLKEYDIRYVLSIRVENVAQYERMGAHMVDLTADML